MDDAGEPRADVPAPAVTSSVTTSSGTGTSPAAGGEPTHAAPASVPAADERAVSEHLVDPAEAVRLLLAKDTDRGAMIERYSHTGNAERDIAAELEMIVPLAQPELFVEAHRSTLYAIEVLDRNGGRPPTLPRLGPLRPLASIIVGLLTRWIANGHQRRLITAMRRLYERREAMTAPGSPEHSMLMRARLQTSRLEGDYRGASAALPAFIVGGAAFSTMTGVAERIFFGISSSVVWRIVFGVLLVSIMFGLGWSVLRAAAVARRRIRMTTDAPSELLWAVIGSCGKPPRDQSYAFAAVAMAITMISWLAVPAVIYLIFGL